MDVKYVNITECANGWINIGCVATWIPAVDRVARSDFPTVGSNYQFFEILVVMFGKIGSTEEEEVPGMLK